MSNSEYVNEIKRFAKNASKISAIKNDKFHKAATIFFNEMADLKHTGSPGSRTWMAQTYISAIKKSLQSLNINEVYHKDSDLNVKLAGHNKVKRADLLVIHNKKVFIIELKSSATLNAIMSAAGEFLIYQNIGGEFSSENIKTHKINLGDERVKYILFSGYCDKSFETDIEITKKAFGIDFHAIAWFRNRKLTENEKWSHLHAIDEIICFLKIIHQNQ